MSLDDRIRQLDERIETLVQQWAEEVHDRVGRSLTEEISRHLEAAKSHVPAPLVSSGELKTLTEAASSFGGVVILRRVRQALKALDGAGKQVDVLNALLDETAPFASRRAIFLTRDNQAAGWAAQGYGEAGARVSGLTVDYQEDGPWTRLAQGQVSIPLSARDCGHLCGRLEVPLPREGILIPIVLRDRVAAALYADRTVEDLAALDVEGLQILAFVAAQSIESLAFRNRTTVSPTLLLEGEEDSSQERLGLWTAAAPSAAAAVAVAAAAAIPASQEDAGTSDDQDSFEVGGEATSQEAEEIRSDDPEAAHESLEDAKPLYRETQDLAAEYAVEEDEGEAELVSEDSPTTGGAPEAAADAPEAKEEGGDDLWAESVSEEAAQEAQEESDDRQELPALDSDEDDAFFLDTDEGGEAPDPALETAVNERDAALETASWPAEESPEGEPSAAAAPPVSTAIPWSDEESDSAVTEEAAPVTTEPAALWDAEEDEQEVALDEVAETPSAPTWEVVDDAPPLNTVAPGSGLETIHAPTLSVPDPDTEDATVLLQRPTAVPSVPSAPSAPSAPSTPPEADDPDETHPGTAPPTPVRESGRASEVLPPSDIQGPGWAFSKDGQEAGEEDEDHKQAKRLARLLVSEIKLYNEEQVEQGQKNRDIYERLREDIDRSRQVYEDRVQERVRSQNDYFYQELVRTLAAGDPQALGI